MDTPDATRVIVTLTRSDATAVLSVLVPLLGSSGETMAVRAAILALVVQLRGQLGLDDDHDRGNDGGGQ